MSDHDLGVEWHFAGIAADFEDEDVEQRCIGNLAIAVYRAKGQYYATQDLCTHEHAYLSDGVVVDCVVECPYHQGRFDIRTGRALGAPVIEPLQTYPVKIIDGRLFVRVTREQAEAGKNLPPTGQAGLGAKEPSS